VAQQFATYVPYSRRTFNDVDPQRHPELFSDADLRREIAMLLRMNKRYGTHHLRVEAYTKIAAFIAERNAK
jgi:hypothetical protein